MNKVRCFFFFFHFQRFFVLDNGLLKYSKSPIDVSKVAYYFKICVQIQPARVIKPHSHTRSIYDITPMKVVDGFRERAI